MNKHWAIRTAALAWLVILTPACMEDSEDGQLTDLEQFRANETLYVTSRNMTREGVQEGRLDADSIHIWDDSTHVRVYGLTVLLFDERGRETGRITAEGGRLSTVGNELWAYGNAQLTVPEDEMNERRHIRAEELFFDLERERIWTGVAVNMQRGNCTVTGDGFESDLSFNNLTIEAPREGGCTES